MGFVEPTKFRWVIDPSTGKRVKKAGRGTKWKARYTDPAGRDRRKTFGRKVDAEKFLERIGTQMQTGEWVDPKGSKSRFDDWADVWWQTTVKLAPSTRRGYEKMLRLYLRPQFGGRKINSIDWLEVELFATSMIEQGLSAKTARETVSVLSLIMQTAMRARVIRENPAAGHSLPSKKQRTQILTMPQIVKLVEHTEKRYQSAIWLLALAGLRASELCGLRVMDIDWDQRTLTVNEVQMWVKGELVVKGPKTASGVRTIPLPAWLIDDLSTRDGQARSDDRLAGVGDGSLVHLADWQAHARSHALESRQSCPRGSRPPPLPPLRPPPQSRVTLDQSRGTPEGHQRANGPHGDRRDDERLRPPLRRGSG